MRAVLAWVLPRPGLFRAEHDSGAARPAVRGPAAGAESGLGRRRLCCGESRRCWRWRRTACRRRGRPAAAFFRPSATRRGRVALLQGCAQQVLAPRINQAAINVLTRHGIEVVLVKDEQCCGALTHHLGRDGDALARARANITVWQREAEQGGLDAILVTTSGCGTVIKDYGFMLREDRDFAGCRREDFRAGKGHHRISRRHRAAIQSQQTKRHHHRLSLGLFAAARTENHARFRKNCFPRMDSW